MTNLHNLSECTDMAEEKFKECLKKVDMKAFIENPTQAFIDAGITLKKEVILKFVETEEEINALPANVFPVMRSQKNNEALSMENLDKIAGGWHYEHTRAGTKGDWTGGQGGVRIIQDGSKERTEDTRLGS
jgi:hypothetical protein